MADDKNGREDQAKSEDRRQRAREVATELERGDEPEPPIEAEPLADLESDLESLSFPATGDEIVAAVGDRELEASDGRYTIEQLLPAATVERFDSPVAVRKRVQRPTVATAMKRVVEATEKLRNVEFGTSQRDAYEKTFLALKAIDADDDDEGIRAIADWIVSQVEDKEKLPGSRAVRREAAEFCRANEYEVSNNDWLGI
jgi:hypothetical protein